ncbi:hypothetical protein [Streptomyces huiliensis]|uniref:hypothetical protein n=1 Tax=Streptomyces huiliensis TaxID=2876027 RepID=UPI001CBE28A9|nr:hypothetical protein [Streptomyces huiliensis]MBZ4323593.1 hypothetical protein [Streptomyces huiliensis]
MDQIAQGLTAVLAELKELGMIGESAAGRGFSDIKLNGMETGHDGLTGTLKTFAERWEWGVRSLVHDGNQFARRVGLAAGSYYEQDQYIKGTLKVGVAAFGADPTLSDEQVEKMSMDEIADHGNFAHVDYSKKSFEESFDHMKRTNLDVAMDSIATGRENAETMKRVTGQGER